MSDESDEPGLLLGEVTPEVRAFLESMGRTVLTVDPSQIADHRADHVVKRASRQNRHKTHHPPAWSPLTTNNWPNVHKALQEGILRHDELISFELGERVASAFRFQKDLEQYLRTIPHRRARDEGEEDDRYTSPEKEYQRNWLEAERRAGGPSQADLRYVDYGGDEG